MPANKIKIEPALLRRFERQSQRRQPKIVPCKIMIVCEGTKTEPLYFKQFKTIN